MSSGSYGCHVCAWKEQACPCMCVNTHTHTQISKQHLTHGQIHIPAKRNSTVYLRITLLTMHNVYTSGPSSGGSTNKGATNPCIISDRWHYTEAWGQAWSLPSCCFPGPKEITAFWCMNNCWEMGQKQNILNKFDPTEITERSSFQDGTTVSCCWGFQLEMCISTSKHMLAPQPINLISQSLAIIGFSCSFVSQNG